MVAKRAAYEAGREALLFDFLLLDRCKMFQSGKRLLHETGRGFFFFQRFFVFIQIVKRTRRVYF